MVEPLRHRQTKGAATDMFYLTPPRHISTLHLANSEEVSPNVCFRGILFKNSKADADEIPRRGGPEVDD
jgi:hypothetical protein